ncbi:hypothetical protein Hamer_G025392, partial [Homarus americanus]
RRSLDCISQAPFAQATNLLVLGSFCSSEESQKVTGVVRRDSGDLINEHLEKEELAELIGDQLSIVRKLTSTAALVGYPKTQASFCWEEDPNISEAYVATNAREIEHLEKKELASRSESSPVRRITSTTALVGCHKETSSTVLLGWE